MRWLRRLGVFWLAWRIFGPERPPRFAPGQEHPLRLEGRSVFVGDAEFFVREAGRLDASPLVLIHGWGDHSLMLYPAMIPRLAGRFRVVAIDNRNSGKSDRMRGPYEVASAADDVAGVVAELGIRRATVFGYSMGGMIAQEMARRHPWLVERLILAGTAARSPTLPGLPPWTNPPLQVLARGFERISRGEWSAVRTRYLVWAGAVRPQHARWYWSENMGRDPNLYWEAGAAIHRFDSRDWVGRLDAPVMVIITCRDQLMPPAAQYELAASATNPTVVELHDARHEGPLTHADRFCQAVEDFAAVDPAPDSGLAEPA